MISRTTQSINAVGRRTALALAMAIGFGVVGSVSAQSTTGRIFGQAAAGETVSAQGTSGTAREVTVDSQGRFNLAALPPGNYTVTLKKDGTVVDTRDGVFVVVGSGTEVPFTAGVTSLATVSVSANALPAIDISGVDSRTVITSQQLAMLPLVRSAEAVALLAPGVVPGSSLFTDANGFSRNLVSFGGSSVVENAYYLNGFNTTDPLSGLGGLTLPYGAIDQQEILSGGYGAAYGRSDGGVISQIGKRGTNEWHFGGQLLYTPVELKSDPKSYYYVNADGSNGKIRQDRFDNKSWNATADAYFGGPLIKDKLYLFGAVEADRVQGQTTGSVAAPFVTHYRTENPKWYGKLDWNITDNNILEITGASNKTSYAGVENNYDYDTHTEGDFNSYDQSTKIGSDLYSAKFTSYVTDNLTFSAMYGQMRGTLYSEIPGYDPTYPNLITPDRQNPAITGGNIITNNQTALRITDPANTSKNTNLRLDVSYKLGDHTITGGIDNQNVQDLDDGVVTSGPGYAWEYDYRTDKNGNPIDPSTWIVGGPIANGAGWQSQPWVEAPAAYPGGASGYYLAKYIYSASGSVRTTQRAQYLEDSWQITDRWLVKLGLRNDQFTNFNSDSIPYLRLTSPQWAPRVGFSWDVNGDSSFKIYGNAGRYYLAMPASVALRAAGSSLYTREYMTYTGIDANGLPTGLTPIKSSTGGPISANLEYGIPRDPKTATSTNLTSEYQDEYILGFDKQLTTSWTYGVKATYRNLRNAIDDVGDAFSIQQKMGEMGIDPTTYDPDSIQGSYLINPGRTSIFEIPKLAGGYYTVPMDWVKDFHFNTTLKRKYYGVNLYLQHAFDGKWFGKLDYLYSRSYGNSEGQVRTDIGQTDVSATVDWDYAAVMDYANGDLANSRRHQIKAYGSYQLAPEWMVSGNLFIASGAPRTCLGLYGPEKSNPGLGYGSYYHFCKDGLPYSPGKQHEPWTYQVNLGAEYRPTWADQKLAFNVNVFNVFDNQTITQRYARSDNSSYLRPYSSLAPRSVRFGVTYDF